MSNATQFPNAFRLLVICNIHLTPDTMGPFLTSHQFQLRQTPGDALWISGGNSDGFGAPYLTISELVKLTHFPIRSQGM